MKSSKLRFNSKKSRTAQVGVRLKVQKEQSLLNMQRDTIVKVFNRTSKNPNLGKNSQFFSFWKKSQ